MVNGIRLNEQNTSNIYNDVRGQIEQAEGVPAEKASADGQLVQKALEQLENRAVYGGFESTVQTALEEAGLPRTERNLSIVRQVLDNQMSIDRDSLNRIVTQVNVFREADISTLLLMNKNNIPVTHFTAAQLQAYINNEQNLSEQIGNSIDGLMEYIGNENVAGNTVPGFELLEFLAESPEILSENVEALVNGGNAAALGTVSAEAEAQAVQVPGNTAPGMETLVPDSQENVLSALMSGQGGSEAVYAAGAGQALPVVDENSVLNMLQTSSVSNVVDELGTDAEGSGANWMNGFGSDNDGLSSFNEFSMGREDTGLSNNDSSPSTINPEIGLSTDTDSGVTSEYELSLSAKAENASLNSSAVSNAVEQETTEENAKVQQNGINLSQILNESEIREFNTLKDSLFNGRADFEGNENVNEVFKEILQNVNASDDAKLKELFGSGTFKKLVKGALNDRFTLDSKDIDSADSINKFYKESFSALSKLSDIAGKNEALADKISKPMDNIKFMDTLNNVFPYIQLPLKFNEGKAHGELYVFKKGRNKHSENDSQSVLLHLDMENLGSTDVHMELKKGFLKLRFYCADETSKELLSENFPVLEQALGDKGFNVGSEFSVRETETAGIVEALSNGNESVPEFRYNFDIRA